MLANKALIVSLSISQWTGRKLDKQATDSVATEFRADRQAGNYTKKLLPGAKELGEVSRLASSIRQFFYENTLPWASDGARIIKSTAYLEFVKAFGTRRGEFEHAVQEFLREYPALREEARGKLGDMFRDSEYPTTARLQNAFNCAVQFMPVPSVDDFRVQVLDSEKEALLKTLAEVEASATRECWTRLYDVVSRAAATLAVNRDNGKPAIFRDSLIENIQAMCQMLPNLNINDDPELESMRTQVEKLAAGFSPDDLRKNSDARTEAARKLDDITAKMSAFMGN